MKAQPLLTKHTNVKVKHASPFPRPAQGAAPLRAATKSANDRHHFLRWCDNCLDFVVCLSVWAT